MDNTVEIREFHIDDYQQAFDLWKDDEGVGLSEADQRASIEKFLARNPGCSFTAQCRGRLAGTILAGHDGRRGYLYHLYVHPDFRRRSIASMLAEKSLEALSGEGIEKTHLFVFRDNASAAGFWESSGFQLRQDISIYSR